MATTTNYGWTTPDDTALVKDGASAIRSLGSSIDTTTKNLNPSTTLGDIEYRSATANTNTRLAIGSSGQVLTVSSGVPAWATPVTGGITLLSTTTLSSTATSVSSISSDYKNLFIVIDSATTDTAPANLTMTVNSLGTGIYGIAALNRSATTVTTVAGSTDTSWQLSGTTGLRSSDTDMLCTILIPDYANTSTRKIAELNMFYIGNGNVLIQKFGSLSLSDTGAISSFTLSLSSGSFNLGTVYTYGVK